MIPVIIKKLESHSLSPPFQIPNAPSQCSESRLCSQILFCYSVVLMHYNLMLIKKYITELNSSSCTECIYAAVISCK